MVTLLCVGCGIENTTTGQAEVAESSAVEENVAEQTTAQAEEPAPEPSAEPVPEPQVIYTYTEMNATMYTTQTVNVRNLPNTDGEKIGSFSTNQEITVLGQCNETSWYKFELDGQTAFVSNSYLIDTPIEVAQNDGGTVTPAPNTSSLPNFPYPLHTWTQQTSAKVYINSFLHLKPISHTPNGFNILRLRRIILNLFTNFLDMDGNGCNITDRIHIPNFPE